MNNIFDWLDEFKTLNPVTVEAAGEQQDVKLYKLDLAKVLSAIDARDKKFFSKLTEDQQKEIAPWVLMRWMTSAAENKVQAQYLLDINALVNNNFSLFTSKKALGSEGHKELQWMLLSLCGTGRAVFRKFMPPGKAGVKNKLENALLKLYPLSKNKDIELLQKINSEEVMKEHFKDNGFSKEEVNEIFNGKSSKDKK